MKKALSEKIFIDTSAWLLFFQPEEPRHQEISKMFRSFDKGGYKVFISSDVVNELVARLVYCTNKQVLKRFLKILAESKKECSITELWVDEQTRNDALVLVEKYYDNKLSLTDCTSIVLMKRFNISKVVTLDSDFIKVGIPSIPVIKRKL